MNVLSRSVSRSCSFAQFVIAATSVILSVGFEGVSMKTAFVLPWIAAFTSSRSVMSTNVVSIPSRLAMTVRKR
ncbi:hypothetical protein D3C73_1607310 [compost metagenome]